MPAGDAAVKVHAKPRGHPLPGEELVPFQLFEPNDEVGSESGIRFVCEKNCLKKVGTAPEAIKPPHRCLRAGIRMKKLRKTDLGLVLLFGGMACATAQGQEEQPSNPATALSEGLGAACRQDEAHFARYLTADNAAAFRELTVAQRTALMKRLILLEEPGRPLLSSDAAGRTVLRCEASSVSAEMRFGDARVRENLAFIPVEARGETRGAGDWGQRRLCLPRCHPLPIGRSPRAAVQSSRHAGPVQQDRAPLVLSRRQWSSSGR